VSGVFPPSPVGALQLATTGGPTTVSGCGLVSAGGVGGGVPFLYGCAPAGPHRGPTTGSSCGPVPAGGGEGGEAGPRSTPLACLPFPRGCTPAGHHRGPTTGVPAGGVGGGERGGGGYPLPVCVFISLLLLWGRSFGLRVRYVTSIVAYFGMTFTSNLHSTEAAAAIPLATSSVCVLP